MGDLVELGSGTRVSELDVKPRGPEWWAGLDYQGKGLAKTVGNGALILQRSPEWAGLRYDEFRNEPVIANAPVIPGFDPPKNGPLDDYAITYISHWLGVSNYHMRLGSRIVEISALVASKGKGRAHHPVRDYLRGLEWDGVRRVDSWLTTYAKVPPGEYVSAVGRKWLIAAVARVMQKVAISKHMLILEGKQDAGKSSLLRALCPIPEWFSDTPIDLGNKDMFQALRGKWIIEIPELDGFRGKDATRIKSYISSPVDNFRKSYGSKNEDVPRQSVFAGSTNERHYLHDASGNVRFWPVRVPNGEKVAFDAMARDRDQIWAEALSYYQDGAAWHITDDKLQRLAHAEQSQREEEDVWMWKVREWFDSPLGRADSLKGVTTGHVLKEALKVQEDKQGRPEQTRVGIILGKLGFEHVPGSDRPRRYRFEDLATEKAEDGEQ